MRVYMVRHGQTQWNAVKRLQGQSDIELTDLGRQQATNASHGVKDIPFDYCYCSPLKRAYETAQLIWGGRSGELMTDERDPITLFFTKPECYVPHDGAESIPQLVTRAQSFLSDLCQKHGAQATSAELTPRILIVAHGALIKGLTVALTGRPLELFWNHIPPINCAMVVADYDAQHGWTLVDECVRLADGVIWQD